MKEFQQPHNNLTKNWKLTNNEALVLALRALDHLPYQEIAKRLKLTRERIRQIHHHAIGKLILREVRIRDDNDQQVPK